MIGFIYWSGYIVVFVFLFAFGAWSVANDERTDILRVFLALFIFPFLSWLLVAFTALSIGFEVIKRKKDDN